MGTTDEGLPDDQVLGATLHAELLLRGQLLATAESLTGGALADLVSASPGASESYLGGVVSYATSVKTGLLGVPQQIVDAHGVVSAQCAEQMAARVRELLGSDWALSTTGVAGPTSQEGKSVGTVFVGLAGPEGVAAHELNLSGDRAQIRAQTCRAAAHELLAALKAAGRG
jgi:nicotinamide-nucleotide amidase